LFDPVNNECESLSSANRGFSACDEFCGALRFAQLTTASIGPPLDSTVYGLPTPFRGWLMQNSGFYNTMIIIVIITDLL
jgi:hypothetical protein